MAKKINENELNNVNGGCGGQDIYQVELQHYDLKGKPIGYWGVLAETSNTLEGIKEIRNKECQRRFANDENIGFIDCLIIKNQHGYSKATIYR